MYIMKNLNDESIIIILSLIRLYFSYQEWIKLQA